MRRRSLLTVVGAGLAGCVSGPDSSGTDSATPVGTLPFEPPADVECAGLPADIDCYGRDDAAVRLLPSKRRVGPGGQIQFVLVNGRSEPLVYAPGIWILRKRVGDDWVRIVPQQFSMLASDLPAGHRHRWTLEPSRDRSVTVPFESSDSSISVAGLGGGTYAFVATGVVGPTPGVTFEIAGGPLTLRPSDELVDVTSRDSTVSARRPHSGPSVTVTVERTSEATDPQVECVESLLRQPVLHDALALLRNREVTTAAVTGPQNGFESTEEETFKIRLDGVSYLVRETASG